MGYDLDAKEFYKLFEEQQKFLMDLMTLHEDYSPHKYQDSLKNPTIGIGCKIDSGTEKLLEYVGMDIEALRSEQGISDEEINNVRGDLQILSYEDAQKIKAIQINEAIKDVNVHYNQSIAEILNKNPEAEVIQFNELPFAKQAVLIDMAYNMGGPHLQSLKRQEQP